MPETSTFATSDNSEKALSLLFRRVPKDGTHFALSRGGRLRYIVPHSFAERAKTIAFFRGWKQAAFLSARSAMTSAQLVFEPKLPLLQQVVQEHPDASLGCLIGVPGAHQKVIGVILSPGSSYQGLFKFPCTSGAKEAIQREAMVLTDLMQYPSLSRQVPQVLATERGEILLQSVLRGKPAFAFTPALDRFVAKLQGGRSWLAVFRQSDCYENIFLATQNAAAPDDAFSKEIAGHLKWLADAFGDEELELAYAHRDLSGWNSCLLPSGELGVFDWEKGAQRYPVLHDFWHFHLAPNVLSGNGSLESMIKMLPQRKSWAECGLSSVRRPHLHLAAYLLDTVAYEYRANRQTSLGPLGGGCLRALHDLRMMQPEKMNDE
jgi:hypothetical protein